MFHLLKTPLFAATWLAFLALRLALIILGWVAVPIAVLFKAYTTRNSKVYPDRTVQAFTWKIMWLWGNEEEGIGYYGNFKSNALKIIYSECYRNPANNLRYVPFFSLKINSNKVKFIGSLGGYKDALSVDTIKKYDLDEEDFWSLSWHGLYSNIRWQGKIFNQRYRFWLGWKIYPEDMFGIPEWSHRAASVGFATQFRRI